MRLWWFHLYFVLPPSEGIAFVIITDLRIFQTWQESLILDFTQHWQQAWTLYRSIMRGQVFHSQHPMRAFFCHSRLGVKKQPETAVKNYIPKALSMSQIKLKWKKFCTISNLQNCNLYKMTCMRFPDKTNISNKQMRCNSYVQLYSFQFLEETSERQKQVYNKSLLCAVQNWAAVTTSIYCNEVFCLTGSVSW